MEKFKQKLKTRIIIMIGIIVVVALTNLVLLINHNNLPTLPDFISGFQLGVFMGFELLLIIFTIKNILSLSSPEKLKKLYIEENDERKKLIKQKTGGVVIYIFIITIAFAALVAGYFNQLIFFTLLATLVFIELVMLALKIYYSKKY